MNGKILKFVSMVVIALNCRIICAHIYKDHNNKQYVLTSVFDAMKNNVRHDMKRLFNRNEINDDSRNKRFTEHVYYDTQPSDSKKELVFMQIHKSNNNSINIW